MADEQTPSKDPVVYGSLNWHLTIASAILAAACLWALYDEVIGKRPWKAYQKDFVARYTKHLEEVENETKNFETKLLQDEELKKIETRIAAAKQAAADEIAAIDHRTNVEITPREMKLTKAMQVARSEVMALTYKLEHAHGTERDALAAELEEVKNRPIPLTQVPKLGGGGETEDVTYVYPTLAAALDETKTIKADLIRERAKLAEPARTIQKELDKAIARKQPSLSAEQVAGLLRKMRSFREGIKQINVPDPIGIVDRCESCHLGIREPLALVAEDFGGPHAKAFTTHPTPQLLKIHNPEQYGCSPCHGGNGAATVSVREAHGKLKHWLWPLYDKENTEAGCLQCHEESLVLDYADTLSAGKELFRYRGCWGCHPRAGFDTERAAQRQAAQAVRTVQDQIEQLVFETQRQDAIANDLNSSAEEAMAAAAKINELTLQISGLQSELIELQRREVSLGKQLKNVGPSLRVVKQKLRPEWITPWIKNPHDFRPTTRMPVFRLPDEHLRAIAAAVWQNAEEAEVPKHASGDIARGKELFAQRGCLACHAIEKDAAGHWIGGQFAPELSRLGEKANYDYIVEWIKDTPDWSLMPNLRLSMEEAQDLAAFVMSHQDETATYDQKTAHLSDPALKAKGEQLIRHYGCAGCHDIPGFENVGKIGTELTTEGNKPIERLDFALHTHDAKRNKSGEGIRYTHKSFFEHKLRKPEYFDEGKIFDDPLARSRMPDFGFTDAQINQLVTFLLGSVDSGVPEALFYRPTGRAKDIVDGWWVIKKYNCMGCHQILPGQTPVIQTLPQFRGENAVYAPPSLVGVGARLNPEWLAKFLRDPAMRSSDPDRNGVRTYLQVRMPTFNLWDEEIGALVRFFEAMSDQTMPYFPPPYPELSEHEVKLAREAFLGMNCLNCHASADQTTFDASVIAPSFVHARDRLKPTWTERWLFDPGKLMIGTRMPAGLFKIEDDRRVVAGPMTDELAAYPGDHIKLFVRYINRIDADEAAFLQNVRGVEMPAAPEEEFEEEEEFLEDE